MEMEIARLGKGAFCCGWNYCRQRLAVGYLDGTVSIHDSLDSPPAASSPSFKFKVHENRVSNVVWLPPEFGDAIACMCFYGTLSLWEETADDNQDLTWKLCKLFETNNSAILDLQFGVISASLKMVVAYSDGHIKVYELLDPMDLSKWQLQAEFQNVLDSVSRFEKSVCSNASIAWNPRRGESLQTTFVIGFSSDVPQFNSAKIWEFDETHHRWLTVAELALPGDDGDNVQAVAWAPNIGRPYEVIAVATSKGIAIWHVGLNLESDGKVSTEKIALLSGHDSEVWQLEWDMSGMTLASSGDDGMVRLWQSNLNGVWHEQAAHDCSGLHPQQ